MTEQLNICIVTCSPNIIFHSAPLTLKSFSLDLAKEEGKIVDNGVARKRRFDKVNDSGNNQSNIKNDTYQNNKHNNNNNSNMNGNNSNKN